LGALDNFSMAKYLARVCPRCGDYLGVVVPEDRQTGGRKIDARCLRCGYTVNWTIYGKKENKDVKRSEGGTVTLQEMIISSLATVDALAKLLIEKGLITEAEFTAKLSAERATYQKLLQHI
jgi:hypothetical protein